MARATMREAKAERLEVRLTASAKALLISAAEARHTTVTDFIVSSAVQEAVNTLSSPKVFLVPDESWANLMAILGSPAKDTSALDRLLTSTPPWRE
jgi:uncharacterized protein (DUF1778 family)